MIHTAFITKITSFTIQILMNVAVVLVLMMDPVQTTSMASLVPVLQASLVIIVKQVRLINFQQVQYEIKY